MNDDNAPATNALRRLGSQTTSSGGSIVEQTQHSTPGNAEAFEMTSLFRTVSAMDVDNREGVCFPEIKWAGDEDSKGGQHQSVAGDPTRSYRRRTTLASASFIAVDSTGAPDGSGRRKRTTINL